MVYFSSARTHVINTTSAATATRKAQSQDDKVMALFNSGPNIKATASQVFDGGGKHHFWTERTPITSIRRSISSLFKRGLLVKLEETRIGRFGVAECYYSLPQPVNAD